MRCVGVSSPPARARMSEDTRPRAPHFPPLVALWQKSDTTAPGSTRRGTRTGLKKKEPPKKKENSTRPPTHPEPRPPTHPIIFNSL